MGQCPKCGAGYNEGDTFCGSCGNDLRAVQQQTMPMPTTPQQPAYPPQHPYPPQQQAYGQQPPAKKSRAGLIVGIVLGVLLLCGACSALGVVGYLRFVPVKNVITQTETPVTEVTATPASSGSETSATAGGGAKTSLEALKARLPKDWVYELTTEQPTMKAYRAGPPASEWVTVYVVEKGASGWTVTSEEPYNGAAGGGETEPADESKAAADLVAQFRTAIKENRPADGQKLTIDPFHSDGASAEYANGEFLSFTITKTTAVGDGTYWVYDSEKWKTFSEKWKFHVVPTEAGLRISDMGPAE